MNNATQHTPPNKMDMAVKQALRSYEAPFNEGHWAEMNSMLETAVPTNQFLKKWSVSVNILIATVLVGGAVVIYQVMNNSPDNNTKHDTNQVTFPNERDGNKNVKPVQTSKEKESEGKEISNSQNATTVIVNKPEINSSDTKTEEVAKDQDNLVKDEKQANDLKVSENPKLRTKPEPAVFGDMIDPKKGAVLRTKEKDKVLIQALTKINDSTRKEIAEPVKKEIKNKPKPKRNKLAPKLNAPADEVIEDVVIPEKKDTL